MGLDVMGSPTKKTKNNKPIKKIKRVQRNNEQQSYSGKRLLSDVHVNVDAAIEKNSHVTIAAFLLELGTCTRVNNCGAFIDNAFGKSGVDVRGGGRGTFRCSVLAADSKAYAFPCVFQADLVHLLFQHPELRPAKLLLFKHLRIFVISPRKSLCLSPRHNAPSSESTTRTQIMPHRAL